MIPFSILHNEFGDIDLSQGLRFTTSLEQYTAQRLDENLSFFLGEWFLDRRLGIPYFERVIGQKPDLALLDTLFRRAIKATPGVGNLDNLQTSFDGRSRTAAVRFTVRTKDGELITQADLRKNFVIAY